jgi:hypothetical protein
VEAVNKKFLLDDNNIKDAIKAKRVKLQRCAKKRSYNDSRNSDEYSNDEDDEDKDKNVVYQAICLVCGEFGKNNEMWLRCVSCGNWAHKACAAVEKKDDYTGCPENGALPMHYGVEEITINVRKMFKKIYWTYLLIWRSLKVALNRSLISKEMY